MLGTLATPSSQSSRTSSKVKFSPASRRATYSPGVISGTVMMGTAREGDFRKRTETSENKLRHSGCIDQRIDNGLEQALALPLAFPKSRHLPCLHDRIRADHDEQSTADLERTLKALVVYRQRAGHCDRIECGAIV